MGEYDEEKAFVMGLVKEVGDLQMSHFGRFVPPSFKDIQIDADAFGNPDGKRVFSEVDNSCQNYILEKLLSKFKNDYVLTEENTFIVSLFEKNKDKKRQWVIDPLDGSYMFMYKKPSFGTVIGLRENEKYVLGAMYQPKEKILYLATEGEGLRKFVPENPDGIEVKLDPEITPRIGDNILLGGGIHNRVGPVLCEQAGGLTFLHLPNLCSVDRTRQVLEGQAKAYLRRESDIYGAGAQMFMVEEAGGIAVNLDLGPPEWVSEIEMNKKVTRLKSYTLLGPKRYCTILAGVIKKILVEHNLLR
ncbi:MAG: inositol monophosphatase family protein [Candidatus Woesearchaeota archaeon]